MVYEHVSPFAAFYGASTIAAVYTVLYMAYTMNMRSGCHGDESEAQRLLRIVRRSRGLEAS